MREINVPALTSVVIPTYNRAEYLPLTVASALAQDGAEVEVIVVDDGSTDATASVVEKYRTAWGERFRYIRQENAERSIARNHGLRYARGEFVAFLDSDDLWRPHHVRSCVAALRANPEAVAAYSEHGLVDANGKAIEDFVRRPTFDLEQFKREVCRKQLIVFPGEVLIRRSNLEDLFGGTDVFDPEAVMLEDWLLWVNLLRTGTFCRVGDATVWRRLHANNTWGNPEKFVQQSIRVTEKVIATGLPKHLGLSGSRILAINRTHCAYAFYLSGQWSLARKHLIAALREDAGVLRERHFWTVALRLCIGKRLSIRIRSARHKGKGNLIAGAQPNP
jgi:glycosyltransferase involved in cell wall biosynthesis